MVNASRSLDHYRRRYIRHAFIEELPEDLQDFGTLIVQMVMRPEFLQQIADSQAKHGGKPVFNRPARFALPGMPSRSRQISAEGLRTFHMGFGDSNRVSFAGASDTYAAAKAALEEGIDAPAPEMEVEAAQDMTDRSAAIADRYATSHGGVEDGRAMTFTNLSSELAERVEQWDRFERQAGSIGLERKAGYETGDDRINVRVAGSPALVAAIAADASCPDALRTLIHGEQQRLAEGRTLNKRREEVGAPLVCEDASSIHDWIRKTPAWKAASAEERKALKLSAGRTRTTYGNFDMEAPAEFDALAFTNVAKGLVAFIAHQPGDPERAIDGAQAPVVASLHRPDELNNDQNWHFHVNHGRYRALFEDDGTLATRDGALVIEPIMPPAMTRLDWKMQLRIEAARLVNIELERLQVTYRLDPRTDKAIGNEGVPMKKLFKEATVAARGGVPTPLRLENAAEAWRRHFVEIDRDRDAELKRAQKRGDARKQRIGAETPVEAQDDLNDLADRIFIVETRGIVARHERRSIEGLIEMRRSAPEEVARYAPEYARKAMRRDEPTFDSVGWQHRAEEATRFLSDLDLELEDERQGIAERLEIEREASRTAERMVSALILDMARATWDDVVPDLSQIPTLASVPHLNGGRSPTEAVVTVGTLATAPVAQPSAAPSPHRAIDLIDTHAIRISVEKDSLFVDPRDDVHARVAGVDLTAAPIQSRLARVKAKQDRELVAIGAYVRRHGEEGLVEERLTTVTGGLPAMIRKWRDTRTVAAMVADISGAAAAPSETEVTPTVPHPPAGYPTSISPRAPGQSSPRALEDLHRRNSDAARQRHRAVVDAQIARALADRSGGANEITPLAARLLRRIAEGFDPDMPRRASNTASGLDATDAIEIGILARDPHFAENMARARAQDSALLRRVREIERTIAAPDMLGLVPKQADYIDFAYRHDISAHGRAIAAGGPALKVRAPSAWMRVPLDRIEADPPLLTRGANGLVGLYDEAVVRRAHANFIGLLHPASQARLQALWYVQVEEKRDVLHRIASGALRVATQIRRDGHTDQTTSLVEKVSAGDPAAARIIRRHAHDPDFYFEVRAVQQGGAVPDLSVQQVDVVARAWIRARDEKAAAAALTFLADRFIGDGRDIATRLAAMPRKDATALCETASARLNALVPPEYRPAKSIARDERRRRRKGSIEKGRSPDQI